MRKILVLTGVLLAVCAASGWAMKNNVELGGSGEWDALLEYDLAGNPEGVASHSDTAYFGGDGTGMGAVVLGGTWTWEADSGETPLFFPDGDPVGNQYRDGWQFIDRTTRGGGPSAEGCGHWSETGVYNFDNDSGAFVHRATTHPHPETGPNSGPAPLRQGWSIWIGTNLYLNPENCGWGQKQGYGDGWSQGIEKSFTGLPANSDLTPFNVVFYHRYAVEAGFDTNVVEVRWNNTGPWGFIDITDIYNGGDVATGPLPGPDGGQAVANLGFAPTAAAGHTLNVRFRLKADAFFSDNNEGGNFEYGWQLDNIVVNRSGVALGDTSRFTTGLDGWLLKRMEGFDYVQTESFTLPVGRILHVNDLLVAPVAVCPGQCLLNRIVVFTDKDILDINDQFQDSYLASPAIGIGGAGQPTLDGDTGRFYQTSLYEDGGAGGNFSTGMAICVVYWPNNAFNCPYDPPPADPGGSVASYASNWSQTGFNSCNFFAQPTSPRCLETARVALSADIPGSADSVIVNMGCFSQCRSATSGDVCDTEDNGAPYFDNNRFGVFNPSGVVLAVGSIDQYSDNYPLEDGSFVTQVTRSDGAHSLSQNIADVPRRWVRSDTAVVQTAAPNAALYLRWRVTKGLCQPNPGHAFFAAFPAGTWHSARMDTSRGHQTGINIPGSYMTCFHEADPKNNTFWTVAPNQANEPCDDILPDGMFTAGTKVEYFFEMRDATSGVRKGTFPGGVNNAPIDTSYGYRNFWFEFTNLPELSGCGGNGVAAHPLLVVNDAQGVASRSRLLAVLTSLGLDFDVYDSMGANFGGSFNGIGRRSIPLQPPRPPYNGATNTQLEAAGYDCVWYFSGLLQTNTLSDGDPPTLDPSQDQQTLDTWLAACSGATPTRLLVLEGLGWAQDIDANTNNGPTFLANRGVGVLSNDYAQDLATNDQRRCARVQGSRLAPAPPGLIEGELFGSGCSDDLSYQVLSASGGAGGGVALMNYIESHELSAAAINCADDTNTPTWHAAVRRQEGEACERSVSLGFPFYLFYPKNCVDECLFEDFVVSGAGAQFVSDQLTWAGKANDGPVGIDPAGAPRLVNALYQAQPNPANPSARIRYTIAAKGRVALRIFDVSGRLVRTLVDEVKEATAEGHEVVWDGTNNAGQRVGAGVFFYQIDTPAFMSAKKLVILK